MKPLAILGGTFDPVHLGHLSVAWEASELLDAEVRLVPARVPPHRSPPHASAVERVALLQAALGGQDRLRLDTRELERDGPSYSVDTLAQLRAEEPLRPLVMLAGADAFREFAGWERWRDIFRLAHIAILSRPGCSRVLPGQLEREVAPRRVQDAGVLKQEPAGRVIELAVTPLTISASHVRELLAAGRDPHYLLPPGIGVDSHLLDPYRGP